MCVCVCVYIYIYICLLICGAQHLCRNDAKSVGAVEHTNYISTEE